MKKIVIAVTAITILAGCSDASVASRNLSRAADNFEIERRIVFFNGITDNYLLSIEGLCSFEPRTAKVDVTCKTGHNEFKKHSLGLSDNVSYFSEQMETAWVDTYHYRVIFKPSAIIPNVEFK